MNTCGAYSWHRGHVTRALVPAHDRDKRGWQRAQRQGTTESALSKALSQIHIKLRGQGEPSGMSKKRGKQKSCWFSSHSGVVRLVTYATNVAQRSSFQLRRKTLSHTINTIFMLASENWKNKSFKNSIPSCLFYKQHSRVLKNRVWSQTGCTKAQLYHLPALWISVTYLASLCLNFPHPKWDG